MVWSLRRIRWVVIYIVVVAAASLPPLFDGKFAFVYLAAVTVPWNGFIIAGMDALDPSIGERWEISAFAISAALNCVALYVMGRQADYRALRRGVDVAQLFLNRERIEGVRFQHRDSVRVVSGTHAGRIGSLVAVLEVEPEPKYVLELESGFDVEVLQSQVQRAYT